MITDILSGSLCGSRIATEISVGQKTDKYGRMALVVSFSLPLAVTLLLGACADEDVKFLTRLATESDPNVVRVGKDSWKADIMKSLLGKQSGPRVPCYAETLTKITFDSMLSSYPVSRMFDRERPTAQFRERLATSCSAPIDPN